jgi:hypothetical protein
VTPARRLGGHVVGHAPHTAEATARDAEFADDALAAAQRTLPGSCRRPAGSGVSAAVAINVRLSFEAAERAVADSPAPAPACEVR